MLSDQFMCRMRCLNDDTKSSNSECKRDAKCNMMLVWPLLNYAARRTNFSDLHYLESDLTASIWNYILKEQTNRMRSKIWQKNEKRSNGTVLLGDSNRNKIAKKLQQIKRAKAKALLTRPRQFVSAQIDMDNA